MATDSQGKSWKILVVDDEPDALDEMRQFIESEGDFCLTAANAEEAFVRLELDPAISIVITDVRMPGIDGLEFVRRTTDSSPAFVKPQFIVVSGHADIDTVHAALRLHVHDFLPKPLSFSALRRAVDSAKQRIAVQVLDRSVSESIATELEAQSRLNDELNRALRRIKSQSARREDRLFAKVDRQDFTSVLRQELRTPLIPILGVASLMRQAESASLDVTRNYGQLIHSEATKVVEILDTILDYYAAETDGIDLAPTAVDLAELVRRVIKIFQPIVHAHRMKAHFTAEEAMPQVICDPQRISQALGQLLSNAVKFSSGEARIDISAKVAGGIAEIVVGDRGEGLSTAEIDLAFEPFKRDIRAGARPQHGVGLGLTIARRFAELHGGSVKLTPRIGRGIEAKLSFPAYSRSERKGVIESSAPAGGRT